MRAARVVSRRWLSQLPVSDADLPWFRGVLREQYRGADKMMMQAIRKVNQDSWPVVMRVGSCFAPQSMYSGTSQASWYGKAKVRIACFTHADLLCPEAIAALVSETERRDPECAVFVVNTAAAKKDLKPKKFMVLRFALYGAAFATGHVPGTGKAKSVLVCGMPNVGKSSVIYPLTKVAVNERRRKELHQARISCEAGHTPAAKAHRLDASPHPLMMTDTPGIVPPSGTTTDEELHWMLCAGFLTTSCIPNLRTKQWPPEVAQLALDGLKRQHQLYGSPLKYPEVLGLKGDAAGTDDAEEVLRHIDAASRSTALQLFLKQCRSGALGPWLLDPSLGKAPKRLSRRIDMREPLVYYNDKAFKLADIGASLKRETGYEF